LQLQIYKDKYDERRAINIVLLSPLEPLNGVVESPFLSYNICDDEFSFLGVISLGIPF